ncbi:MAG: hypothetical protein CVT63_07075 [Candidatus Anoxymicrobium japonicum]|uniref:Uncharacterized protein n=1 Tax=Candidatus Anoxymicrobium japonicum TaxID=2013648 RepID=A0A2N3G4G5_9ACTN|nr:MAG: hypothetical protein CVT63_07075 [Candidatus Anoxymicrobium japonicum]
MTKGKVVWLVEDSQEEADEYGQLLERAGDIEVLFVSVRPTIADYADLLADDQTGAFIIDQCLDEYTGVAYNGIGLAEFLRSLRPELPIFILTKYLDEGLEDQGGSVEAIIDKKTVRKRGEIYVKRILRGIEHYQATLTDKQERLGYLIDRKLSGGLSEAEEVELQELRAYIERPLGLTFAHHVDKWEAELRGQEQRLEQLEKIASNFRDSIRKVPSTQD